MPWLIDLFMSAEVGSDCVVYSIDGYIDLPKIFFEQDINYPDLGKCVKICILQTFSSSQIKNIYFLKMCEFFIPIIIHEWIKYNYQVFLTKLILY